MAIGAVLLTNEYLWQKKLVRGEASRKLAHILIGSFIATWPMYMSWHEIRIALVIGFVSAVVVRKLVLFPSIFDVKRRTYGDIAAPLIIIIAAMLEPTRTIFAVAVLHVAFADGMAALIGSRFGRKKAYNIMKQKKTVIGTLTFYVCSMIIMTTAAIFKPTIDIPTTLVYIGVIPILATYIENISPNGLDNIFVPGVVITLLLFF
ncbi:hypothetical protein BH23PAT2_BH23PAT2_10060 [soil metagenome]